MFKLKFAVVIFAALGTASLLPAAAHADALADYYRSQFKLHVCPGRVNLTSEERDALGIEAEQEVMDISATSDDIAAIFDALQAEHDADPDTFCNGN